MKRSLLRLLRVLVPVVLLASSVPAEAKLFEVWGSGLAGGGWGDGGDSPKDFYRWARGGAAGVEVGIKILFIGAFVDYLRWFGGEQGADLITFNLGGDFDINLVKNLSLIIRVAGGYYHGLLPSGATIVVDGVPVDQVNTRGVGARAGIGLRYSFLKVFSVGCTPEVGYHYFFGGAESSITDDNSSGWDLSVLGYFRVGFGF